MNTLARWWRRRRPCSPQEPGLPSPPDAPPPRRASPSAHPAALEEHALAARLRHAAATLRPAPSPARNVRIMAAVRREAALAQPPAPQRISWGFRVAAVGAAGFSAVLALVLLPPFFRPAPEPPRPLFADLVPRPEELARWGTLLDQPLREEGRLVLQDARNAVNGLATVLLPQGSLLASHPADPR